jgi:hypothetical protein
VTVLVWVILPTSAVMVQVLALADDHGDLVSTMPRTSAKLGSLDPRRGALSAGGAMVALSVARPWTEGSVSVIERDAGYSDLGICSRSFG